VEEWFTTSFAGPTPAQEQGWPAIAGGDHTLILAPTGSGKTLAAFLWGLDRLTSEPVPDTREHRTRVVYVSPLRALAVDVERNLRSPLNGIALITLDGCRSTPSRPRSASGSGGRSRRPRRRRSRPGRRSPPAPTR